MTIDEVHKFIRSKLNENQGSYVSSEEIDAALNLAQMEEFREMIAILREYKDNRVYGNSKSQSLADAKTYLSPFLIKGDLTSDSSGEVILPTNLEYISSAYGSSHPLPIIDEDQWIETITSDIIAPTESEPAALQAEPGKLQLFPESEFSFTIVYYRKPVSVQWSYTLSGRNAIYNSGSSIQLEWKDRSIPNIITKALQHLGVQVRSPLVIQEASNQNKPGQ